jgi:hypothetical protein
LIFVVVKFVAGVTYFIYSWLEHKTSVVALANLLQAGDAHNYLSVAINGYDTSTGEAIVHNFTNLPFFPLLPLLLHVLIYCHINVLLMIILNQVLMLSSVFLLYTYTNKIYNRKIAYYASCCLIVSHIQAYSYTIYTENLFLVLLLIILVLVQSKKYFSASAMASLLSSTRFIGFLVSIVIAIKQYRSADNHDTSLYLKIFGNILLSCSGLLIFAEYLHYHNNDALAFYHGQASWGRCDYSLLLRDPLQSLKLSLHSNFIDKIFFIIYMVEIFYFIRVKKYGFALWLILLNFPALVSLRLLSFARFTSTLPFTYIFFGVNIADKKLLRQLLLAVLLGLQLYYMYLLSVNSTNLW